MKKRQLLLTCIFPFPQASLKIPPYYKFYMRQNVQNYFIKVL